MTSGPVQRHLRAKATAHQDKPTLTLDRQEDADLDRLESAQFGRVWNRQFHG